MKTSLNFTNITKKELIDYCNNIVKIHNKLHKKYDPWRCGCCTGYKISSTSKQSHQYIEECFIREWEWLRDQIQIMIKDNQIDGILEEIDTTTLKSILNKMSDELTAASNEYNHLHHNSEVHLHNVICKFITDVDILTPNNEITVDDIIVNIHSGECVEISIQNGHCSSINYHHLHSRRDVEQDNEYVDKINFGTIGSFDLDSLCGQQQIFMMSLIIKINNDKKIRDTINSILDSVHVAFDKYCQAENKIKQSINYNFDNIIGPFIDGVALGKYK